MSRDRRVYLVCEGPRNGWDMRLLDRLIVQRCRSSNVRIEAANGDSGLGSVALYLRDRDPSGVTIIVEDRNYRPRAEVDLAWKRAEQDAGNALRVWWTRHELENYLLEPLVIAEALSRLPAHVRRQTWPDDDAAAERLLRALAEPLLPAHAVQLVWWQARVALNASSVKARCPVAPDADEPTARTALLSLGAQTLRDAEALRRHPELEETALQARLDATLAELRASGYRSSISHCHDLDGHALFGRLCAALGLKEDFLKERLLDALAWLDEQGQGPMIDDLARLRRIVDRATGSGR